MILSKSNSNNHLCKISWQRKKINRVRIHDRCCVYQRIFFLITSLRQTDDNWWATWVSSFLFFLHVIKKKKKWNKCRGPTRVWLRFFYKDKIPTIIFLSIMEIIFLKWSSCGVRRMQRQLSTWCVKILLIIFF